MRLIDADELLAQMIGMNDGWFDPRPAYDHESLIKIQPTVDAVPVKHGRWVNMKNGNADCSVCGRHVVGVYDDDNADKYCRCCGSRMDLEEQDERIHCNEF